MPSTKTPEEAHTTSTISSTKRTSTLISTSTTQKAETSTKKLSSAKFRTKTSYLSTVKTIRTTKWWSENIPFTRHKVKTNLIPQSTQRLITKPPLTTPSSKKSDTSSNLEASNSTTVDPTVFSQQFEEWKVSDDSDKLNDVSIVLIALCAFLVIVFVIFAYCFRAEIKEKGMVFYIVLPWYSKTVFRVSLQNTDSLDINFKTRISAKLCR